MSKVFLAAFVIMRLDCRCRTSRQGTYQILLILLTQTMTISIVRRLLGIVQLPEILCLANCLLMCEALQAYFTISFPYVIFPPASCAVTRCLIQWYSTIGSVIVYPKQNRELLNLFIHSHSTSLSTFSTIMFHVVFLSLSLLDILPGFHGI